GPFSIGPMTLTGAGLGSSIGLRSSVKPGTTASFGPMSIDGYAVGSSYASGEASTLGKTWIPGDLGTGGRLLAGVDSAPTYHAIAAPDLTDAGDEVLRISGANFLAGFYERGAGGSGGANAANAVLKLGTMDTTGRSL